MVAGLFARPSENAGAQQPPAVIDLPSPTIKSSQTFGSVLNVVEFSNGNVMVNDATARQLVLLNRNLAQQKVVLDSSLSSTSYGRGSVPLVFCNCAEVWFPDVQSSSLLTFDESGAQKRVISAPNTNDFYQLIRGRSIGDTIGNLFYRGRTPNTPFPGRPKRAGDSDTPDSTPLLRANFETRKIDTIAKVRTLRPWTLYSGGAAGANVTHIAIDILAMLDEWTATPDGTVAIVRGHDYHVDWLLPNGSVVASAKLPFDFKRLTDADKAALMDSARKAELIKHKESHDKAKAAGGIEVSVAAGAGGSGVAVPLPRFPVGEYKVPVIDSVPFDRMPDYYPPIRDGAVSADLAGNVWILPTTSAQSRKGELVYDVVNRQRGLIARVRIPSGRSIAGFGRNGVVYLTTRDASGAWTLEKATLPSRLM